ncbi:LysR family transcriptional regulator [Ciceribacter sp. L1K23]|uniref:LysR family transcriptional regulator n=1 Tax=Ciceribacter sp. L1K23 TaxID=2820276 RepID=UPI001B817AFC|nr:LysR family transcriptional regulator [Ciceribacter sp. L1K23]MBR0555848.1 LysR family transcriptional regulator [Ciceribacter sp. L1K23]
MLPNPTLDQLQVFVAVAEAGSFSAAARRLNRAQSVVSYTIANLEAQLQLALFDRSARNPVLTAAGRGILEDARRMMADLDTLRARASSLTQGLEAEVHLGVSVLVPEHVTVDVLRRFQETFPNVALRLTTGSPFRVIDMVHKGQLSLGIGGQSPRDLEDVASERIGLSFMAAMAAPDHALAKAGRRLLLADVREETQIVVADDTGVTGNNDFNVFSRRAWRVSDMGTKRQLLIAGLGWGGMPLSVVAHDITEGRLVQLDVEPYEPIDMPVEAQWPRALPPGPAGRWLLEQYRQSLSHCPTSLGTALQKMAPADTAPQDAAAVLLASE